MKTKKKIQTKVHLSGFSLVELMVTIGIVVLVTGIVMVRYSSFNSAVLLNSQAYLLAFDLREAQSLAISVRGRGDEFRQEYGMYFDVAGNPNQYLLFQDNNSDILTKYNEGEEINEPYVIDPRFTIVDLCGTPTNTGIESCYSTGGPEYISISFARPDFDAEMHGQGFGSNEPLSSARIIVGVSDNDDFTKTVEVTASGQISVE